MRISDWSSDVCSSDLFKAGTGLTPKAYAVAHRARRVRTRLDGAASITDAIYDAGFEANSRFYETADQRLGMRPKDFRAGGANTDIRFAVGECSLGSILVARSGRGECAIALGDDPDALARELPDRFPNANLIEIGRAHVCTPVNNAQIVCRLLLGKT